jgi:hypothetical protein
VDLEDRTDDELEGLQREFVHLAAASNASGTPVNAVAARLVSEPA